MREKAIPVYLSLPEHVNERIDQLAEETGRSTCKYIRQIIRKYLKYLDQADQTDAPPLDWRVD